MITGLVIGVFIPPLIVLVCWLVSLRKRGCNPEHDATIKVLEELIDNLKD